MPSSGPKPSSHHVVLVGAMAAGKSSVARALARRLRRPVLDNDEQLEAAQGATGRETAAQHGIASLHEAEAQHLLEAMGTSEPAVIAAAASVVDVDRCRQALKPASVIWLRIDPRIAAQRMGEQTHRRSLGQDAAGTLSALAVWRDPRYDEVADLAIDVDDMTVPEIVDRALQWLTQGSHPSDESPSD